MVPLTRSQFEFESTQVLSDEADTQVLPLSMPRDGPSGGKRGRGRPPKSLRAATPNESQRKTNKKGHATLSDQTGTSGRNGNATVYTVDSGPDNTTDSDTNSAYVPSDKSSSPADDDRAAFRDYKFPSSKNDPSYVPSNSSSDDGNSDSSDASPYTSDCMDVDEDTDDHSATASQATSASSHRSASAPAPPRTSTRVSRIPVAAELLDKELLKKLKCDACNANRVMFNGWRGEVPVWRCYEKIGEGCGKTYRDKAVAVMFESAHGRKHNAGNKMTSRQEQQTTRQQASNEQRVSDTSHDDDDTSQQPVTQHKDKGKEKATHSTHPAPIAIDANDPIGSMVAAIQQLNDRMAQQERQLHALSNDNQRLRLENLRLQRELDAAKKREQQPRAPITTRSDTAGPSTTATHAARSTPTRSAPVQQSPQHPRTTSNTKGAMSWAKVASMPKTDITADNWEVVAMARGPPTPWQHRAARRADFHTIAIRNFPRKPLSIVRQIMRAMGVETRDVADIGFIGANVMELVVRTTAVSIIEDKIKTSRSMYLIEDYDAQSPTLRKGTAYTDKSTDTLVRRLEFQEGRMMNPVVRAYLMQRIQTAHRNDPHAPPPPAPRIPDVDPQEISLDHMFVDAPGEVLGEQAEPQSLAPAQQTIDTGEVGTTGSTTTNNTTASTTTRIETSKHSGDNNAEHNGEQRSNNAHSNNNHSILNDNPLNIPDTAAATSWSRLDE
ncbi:hypothetical protein RI367_008346 [Sorochytrium milnesiophthora]